MARSAKRGAPAVSILAGGIRGWRTSDEATHGRTIGHVSTRIRSAPPVATIPVLVAAAAIRRRASRTFGELAGVKWEQDRSRILGALLAYAASVNALVTSELFDHPDAVRQMRAVEDEIMTAARWSIAAIGAVSR